MTTTLMRDSTIGDKFLQEMCEQNPTVMLPGEGRLISTGPCRLAFCDALWEPKAPMGNPNGTPKYSTAALYSPFVNMQIFNAEYFRICGEMFAENYNPHTQNYSGLEYPFHDAADKAHKFKGYTPGCMYVNHTSKFKPPIVYPSVGGAQPQIITDRSKVYPGVWAILVVNAYGYGKSPPQPKKGVSFGLQAVMIIADDTNLSGGAVDPGVVFAGAKVKPPTINPGALAGVVPPPPGGGATARPPMSGGYVPPPPPTPSTVYGTQHLPQADEDLSSMY